MTIDLSEGLICKLLDVGVGEAVGVTEEAVCVSVAVAASSDEGGTIERASLSWQPVAQVIIALTKTPEKIRLLGSQETCRIDRSIIEWERKLNDLSIWS